VVLQVTIREQTFFVFFQTLCGLEVSIFRRFPSISCWLVAMVGAFLVFVFICIK
jgi:hypothetical protein